MTREEKCGIMFTIHKGDEGKKTRSVPLREPVVGVNRREGPVWILVPEQSA